MEIQTINIQMLNETINEAKEIQSKVNALSFSDAIKTAVDIAYMIVDAANKGNKIIIEERWGNKYEINIDGIN